MDDNKIVDLTPITELLENRKRILESGTTDEVIDLAKEFHINQTVEHSTTYYKDMVEKLKVKCTELGIDWTTL